MGRTYPNDLKKKKFQLRKKEIGLGNLGGIDRSFVATFPNSTGTMEYQVWSSVWLELIG